MESGKKLFLLCILSPNKIDVLFARQNYIDGWGSTFQEIIIYPTNQSANKTGIEANINSKYKLN